MIHYISHAIKNWRMDAATTMSDNKLNDIEDDVNLKSVATIVRRVTRMRYDQRWKFK